LSKKLTYQKETRFLVRNACTLAKNNYILICCFQFTCISHCHISCSVRRQIQYV